NEKIKQPRLNRERHQNDYGKSDNRNPGNGINRRVTGKNQNTKAQNRCQRRHQNSGSESRHFINSVSIFFYQSAGDENRIIYAQTKNQSCDNDVERIEIQSEKSHHSQSGKPTDKNRNIGNQREFERTEE